MLLFPLMVLPKRNKNKQGLLPPVHSHNSLLVPAAVGSQVNGMITRIANLTTSPRTGTEQINVVRTGTLRVGKSQARRVGKVAHGTGEKSSFDPAG